MTQQLLRTAHRAIRDRDFDMAKRIYKEIRTEQGDSVDPDVLLRFAYCAEQTGDYEQAVAAYRDVMHNYRQNGEQGEEDAIFKVLQRMQKFSEARQIAVDSYADAPTPKKTTDSQIIRAEEMVDPKEFQPQSTQIMRRRIQMKAMSVSEVMAYLMQVGSKRMLETGEQLCAQGAPSTHLWLLYQGELKVWMAGYDEADKLSATADKPCFVGEIGFFTKQSRAATLIAAKKTSVIELSAKQVNQLCKKYPKLRNGLGLIFRERIFECYLARHAVFERMNDIARKQLSIAFTHKRYPAGKLLIQAGQEHDGMYLVQSGCLLLLEPKSKDVEINAENYKDNALVSSMSPGDIIHLGGLLRGYKGEYQVVTATTVDVLHLSVHAFEPFKKNRPWIIQAILQHSRKPASQQVLHPDDSFMWKMDRHVDLDQEQLRTLETTLSSLNVKDTDQSQPS
ncbi:MAG: cyclic nucleotide-binding domain-containing protein [Mariprofundaceae bacterium]|nr:cyclic nucleotide-binding domain-containing protein [Mariprofundaceae bacterium]